MSLDPHHVHNFWGTSPGLDLKEVVTAARASASSDHDGDGVDDGTTKDDDEEAPLTALLVGTSDPRHIFTTLARSRRRGNPNQPLHFHVHESNMVESARHILLLCILMTDDLPPTDRMVGSWDDLPGKSKSSSSWLQLFGEFFFMNFLTPRRHQRIEAAARPPLPHPIPSSTFYLIDSLFT